MSSDVQFYTNPMSRGQIARWALHEAGASYEERLLEYGAPMHSEAYRSVNPMAKVPAIVHEGNVVTETAAICAYLARAFPGAELEPTTLSESAVFYRWLFFAAGPLEQAVVARSMKWDEGLDPSMEGMIGFGSFERVTRTLSDFLSGRAYVCGERFTAADIYVGAQVDWGLKFGTLPNTPALVAYAERLRARPAHQAAAAIDLRHIEDAKAGQA